MDQVENRLNMYINLEKFIDEQRCDKKGCVSNDRGYCQSEKHTLYIDVIDKIDECLSRGFISEIDYFECLVGKPRRNTCIYCGSKISSYQEIHGEFAEDYSECLKCNGMG